MRLGITLLKGRTLDALTKSAQAVFTRLDNVLRQLTFEENFESFSVDLEIPPGKEQQIGNSMRKVPTRYMVERSTSGALVGKSGIWNKEHVYLSNLASTETFVGRVRFFR